MEKLILTYIGEDNWSRPVFKDPNGKIFKDTSLGIGPVELCTVSAFDDEPDTPIRYIEYYKNIDIEIHRESEEKIPTPEEKFNYRMLSRLQTDCEYYIVFGNKNPRNLWALDEKSQIDEMKKLHNSFSEEMKPEWLTWEQILEYEKQMIS